MNQIIVAILPPLVLVVILILIGLLLSLVPTPVFAPSHLAPVGGGTYHPQLFVEMMQARNRGASMAYWQRVRRDG